MDMNTELQQSDVVETDVVMKLSELKTKSDKIRYLTSIGWKRGRIAKHLGIPYQHVRNVQLQPLKKKELA